MHVSLWPQMENFPSVCSVSRKREKWGGGQSLGLEARNAHVWILTPAPPGSLITFPGPQFSLLEIGILIIILKPRCKDEMRSLCENTEGNTWHRAGSRRYSSQGSGKNEHASGSKTTCPLPVPWFHALSDFFFHAKQTAFAQC